MPQTNKSVGAGNASGPACSPDQGEPPPPARDVDTQGDAVEEQGDPEIVKSPSDPKKYRYIQLSNGLRALLISDLSAADGKTDGGDAGPERDPDRDDEDDDDDEADSGEGSEEDDEDDEEEEQDSDFEDEDEDSAGKKKKKSAEKQAAAALCVGVGSFSDPDELPGLAHFLEHMVFMGSEKYPAENGFDAFLKKHGGSDNASTDCERTVFQFDVQKKHFREALDRWAQFFICPLMIKDAVDREVEAVDSEYQLARPSDSHRKEMLFGGLAVPGHPMSKFCWGNAQTLKHEPRERGIDTYRRLRQFWRRFYSAHYMTLAVQSKETLVTLEQWVREIFVHIPNNAEPAVDFSHLPRPFDTPAFNKLYRVVPVRKVHALTVSWALPPQGKHYRVKPLHYISWLIGHEGSGSILSLLRRKCWALALFGGNSETGFDQNTTYSVFSVSITLTDEGFRNFYQVVHLVFQYLKMLQTLGPQQRIYEEIQKIEDNEFHYQEQTDPIEFVENICENMHLFPKEDFLTGDQLMFHFDPEVIGGALSSLTPARANLLLLSPEHEGHCQIREKWFGTSYSVEDIPAEWAQRWASDLEVNPELHLPAENKFIASDFTLRPSDCPDTEFPVKIWDDERGCLWYKKDTKFKIPKAYIRFHLISPMIQKSPENLVLFDLFVNILAHNLAEPAYEADVAQLEYKLVAGEHGLLVRLRGFNHKLPLLLKLVVEHIAAFSSDAGVFGMFSEQLKKAYFNILIKPDRLGKDVRLLILERSRWSLIQKYRAVVAGLTLGDLLTFVGELKAELYVEGLVQGNFTGAESKVFLHYFTERLRFRPLSAEVPVSFRVVELPAGHHLCKVKSLNKGDANSEVTVYYQSGLKNLREHALMELLVMHMEEPCFDFLRTKETLGYHVYPTCRNTSGVLGFSVTVETQASKFSTELVESKVEEFLQSFGERLSALSDEAFGTQVTALVKLKECEDAHLGEEVDRNWFEVLTKQYLFQRLNMEISALKGFTREDLLSWFVEHRHGGRKLSVHVVGFGTEEGDPPEPDRDLACASSSYGEVSSLSLLAVSSPALRDAATAVGDIRAFASGLPLHPHHKILS
ncbi:nardilysin-like isoform X1 [Phyllopteryx taeniolatus]|uniref:nardilysin-like isoform X1 n=2 Tax=Phyllopteryx taeniolatus TaxID=161469 RepID=UPI002AD4783A|nr:nardilysin-like isoform X1 [Phyllopteryx taeniolatus]XP_061636391.1 nardilysin-like isoform X1 [Phyllopteryx taeniolatus]